MKPVPLRWLERTGDVHLYLRRYHRTDPDVAGDACPLGDGLAWHDRMSGIVERRPIVYTTHDDGWESLESIEPDSFAGHEWWPVYCECGYAFTEGDARQVIQHEVLVDVDGAEYDRNGHGMDLPPGSCFDAWWHRGNWAGADGISLMVITPDQHAWSVDMQASNCDRQCPWGSDDGEAKYPEHATQPMWLTNNGWTTTSPSTGQRAAIRPHDPAWCDPFFENHKCWVRTGNPREPSTLHVSKGGETCSAGAGSILTPTWHGFLRHGHLTT